MQKTVVDDRWQAWANSHPKYHRRAGLVKCFLMDDAGFWHKLAELKNTFMPIYRLLRKVSMGIGVSWVVC